MTLESFGSFDKSVIIISFLFLFLTWIFYLETWILRIYVYQK